MDRIGGGIDENLNDRRHEQEAEGRKAAGEPDGQQDRKEVFADKRQIGRDVRRDQRQLVLLAKQPDRIVGQGEERAFSHLGARRHPEDDRQGEARQQGHRPDWYGLEQADAGFDEAHQRIGHGPACHCRGHGHVRLLEGCSVPRRGVGGRKREGLGPAGRCRPEAHGVSS